MDHVPERFNFVLVGNGSLNLFLARELVTRAEGTVAIVGPRGRNGGASAAAGAMLGCFGEVTADSPRSDSHMAKFGLGLAAHKRWPAVIEQLQGLPGARDELAASNGTFVILNSCGSELDSRNFEAIINQLNESGEHWEETNAIDIPGYRPRPQSRAQRAIFLPNEWGINARGLLSAMEETLAADPKVTFIDTLATKICVKDGTATGVKLCDGTTIEADAVVIGAGAFSGGLLPDNMLDAASSTGATVQPTFAGIGVALTALRTSGTPFQHVVRTPNRAFACGLHLVPQGNGVEYVGATNALLASPQLQPFLGDMHFLTDCALGQLDEAMFHHQILKWHTGNRPATLDGLPLVGWIAPRLYLLTGTYRDGLHAAPVLAEHTAQQLHQEPGHFGDTFDPLRSPIAGRTVSESIEHFAAHRMAAWFESGVSLPHQTPSTSLERTFRDQAALIYERMKIEYGLSPDVLMHLIGSLGSHSATQVFRYLRSLATKPLAAPTAELPAVATGIAR